MTKAGERRRIMNIFPTGKIMNEMIGREQPRHIIILGCDSLAVKKSYLSIVNNFSGEMQNLILDEYIKLCKQDGFIN